MKDAFRQAMWQSAARCRRRPMIRLIEHFFNRFFETSAVARDPYSRMGPGPILGVVAVPGAVMSLILFMKYSPLARWFGAIQDFDIYLAAIPDKYTFIVFSMVATGIVTVMKWESLFPDRQDFANLAPLPLSTAVIFFAKLFALIAFACVFAIDLNLFSSVLFPFIAMENTGGIRDLVRFIGAHSASVVAASTFAFCAFAGLAGLLMTLLPYAAFRRATRYLQFIAITVLVLMFLLTPLITPGLMRVRNGIHSFHEWLPPVWFLGLSESWHGKATPAFELLAGKALEAFGILAVIAGLSYALAYRRYFLKTAESPEIVGRPWTLPQASWAVLDRTILRTPFERGCFRFMAKTLFRSDRHTGVLAAFLGVGAALAVQSSLVSANDPGRFGVTVLTLSASLTLVFFLITALRLCFGIAQEERANWMFQISMGQANPDARGVVRKFILLSTAVLVVASIPIYVSLAGLGIALVHAAFTTLNAVLLLEFLLLGFCNIPFTCTHLPGRDNLVLAVVRFATAFLIFAPVAAHLEYWLLRRPAFFIAHLLFIGGALFALRFVRDVELPIEYEQRVSSLELLRLSE